MVPESKAKKRHLIQIGIPVDVETGSIYLETSHRPPLSVAIRDTYTRIWENPPQELIQEEKVDRFL